MIGTVIPGEAVGQVGGFAMAKLRAVTSKAGPVFDMSDSAGS